MNNTPSNSADYQPYEPPDEAMPSSSPRSANRRVQTLWLAAIFGAMYFIQGVAEPTEGLISQPVKSLLSSWGQSVGQVAAFAFIIALPWSLKPLFGLLTDFVPLGRSRRKIYLVLCNLAAIGGLLALYSFKWQADAIWLLCLALLLPTVAVAFSDVVVDALMIENGQPLGITGTLQGAQWASIYAATILTGTLGGWLSQHDRQELGFLICALATVPALFISLFLVREQTGPMPKHAFKQALADLWSAAKNRPLWAVAAYLFLWNFNPFSTTVLQLHMTTKLGMSEQFYGNMVSLMAMSAVVASLLYALYCRFVPRRWLVQASIVLGIVSTLGYFWLTDEFSAIVITLCIGFTYMTATLIQLDLAAQACPPRAAGTVFATLMALSNFSVSFSTGLGGRMYDDFETRWSSATAFNLLVGIGALCTACCWALYPWLRKSNLKPQSESP